MTSVREDILADLVTTCSTITTGNGYNLTVMEVERYEAEGQALSVLPAILVIGGRQTRVNEASGRVEWSMQVLLDCFRVHNPVSDPRSSDELLSEMASDVIKAMMTDRTRSGYAIDTDVVEIEPYPVIPNTGRDINVVVELEIHFRHIAEDPEDQGT